MDLDDLYDADDNSEHARMWRYATEVERLLATGELSLEARARCLASLIELTAAEKMRAAVDAMQGDVVEPLVSAVARLSGDR